MNKNRIFVRPLLLLVNLFCSPAFFAQQQLVSNQNTWLLATENIAAVPESAALSMQGLYRRNWLSFDQSPELMLYRLETSNSSHGWDFKIQQYSNSFYRRQELKVGWRYALKLDDNQNLKFGIRLGFLRTSYSWSNLHAQNPEELSELFMQNNWTNPAADIGFQYTYSTFRFSIYGTNLNLITSSNVYTGILELPSFSVLTSYSFKVSKNTNLSPVLQLRSVLGLPITYDYSILLEKEKNYGLQCGFKNRSLLYANMRFYLSPQLAFSFSYDYPISINKLTGSGSELTFVYFTK